MLVGYNWHVGGLYQNSGVERGSIKHFKHGYGNLTIQEGVEGPGPKKGSWNDDLDGIRIQKLTKPTSSQMEYHIEHHMFPMVPSHQLPKLHDLIKDHLPEPCSLYEAYREIIPAIIRQAKDPTYHIAVHLPETKEITP